MCSRAASSRTRCAMLAVVLAAQRSGEAMLSATVIDG